MFVCGDGIHVCWCGYVFVCVVEGMCLCVLEWVYVFVCGDGIYVCWSGYVFVCVGVGICVCVCCSR